ncbi:Mg-chelatase subunit ChlD [Thioflavicoccus mobilis 8321]|uniref:Mg-chelatase subunit ChlD n=1 Tax=Thioflavicoccus mobilis 8321 TaxID=765912 RepID=L0H213_9GAMM|nr:VWA domain-containing protein [Thioflavicoccus mobilis]AGA91624.1 Mg-chelatase subunit ChlD [Thioflavicoccus mobilis 8321]
MLTLAWPWMLLALPLPLAVRRWLPPAPDLGAPALRLPQWRADETAPAAARVRRWRWVVALLAWVLLVGAAARPEWLGEPLAVPLAGRDLMLAVDISGSMEQPDFVLDHRRVSRLGAVKAVASRFIDGRRQDRVGLILFGSRAYLQTPLTFDRTTVVRLLDEAVVGLAGRDTAIGDAIALAVKRLRDEPGESRVLILLTDGENNAGNLTPQEAAGLAEQAGVRVYIIGIDRSAEALSLPFGLSFPGREEIDSAGLTAIAEATGGRFFKASNTDALEAIYAELDRLEPSAHERSGYRPSVALFQWPLAVALLLSTLLFLPGWGVGSLRRRLAAGGDVTNHAGGD